MAAERAMMAEELATWEASAGGEGEGDEGEILEWLLL